MELPAQTFAYDNTDRITAYTWDNNGNLLSDGIYTYSWNAKNQLIAVTGSGVDVSYTYDGDGLRISRTDNSTNIITYYIWDTENHTGYPQVMEEVESGQVVKRYGYGHFLENIDLYNGTDYDRYYIIRDAQNSVRVLLDETGVVVANYDYDAYGNVLTGTQELSANSYGFHTECRDSATGLIYLRARWYNPRTGRFLNMDSYEGQPEQPATLHKYMAFGDSGVNFVDPSGMHIYSNITWGRRVLQLLAGLFGYHPVLEAKSIIRENYDGVGNRRGMTGTQKLLWIEQGRMIRAQANNVIWSEVSQGGSYEYPARPGFFRIVRSPANARFEITIEHPEPLIRYHGLFNSEGCIVYGRDPNGLEIRRRINHFLDDDASVGAILKVIDNRNILEKFVRPLPYWYLTI